MSIVSFFIEPFFSLTYFWLIAFTVLLSWLITKYLNDNYDYESYNKIPGPKPWPILGNADRFRIPRYELRSMFENLYSEYGPVVRIKLGSFPYVLMHEVSTCPSFNLLSS